MEQPSHFSEPQATAPQAMAPHSAGRILRFWLLDIVVALFLAVFVITFLYVPVRVEGTSMAPQLADSDRVFVNKLAYHVGDVHRQDVVIFRYPNDPTKTYIKRIIAEPGDTLRIEHGSVFLNGQLLQEPYVAPIYRDDSSMPETRIPEGEYFVMGDHRNISSDSREFGPVARGYIYGKAMFVYWPSNEAGWVR